ncbi:hypothetical protein DAEQUDRAFT_733625 [Daedalea quercina L-15889]|uniref:Uncharacterized protein n=1 Tax=Daedalea quercina L-15889 TaxID=1314783 RepID=A0A165KV19_9APHY|nr:hypothetical protein DAEQUDRAFT_733625 [Daedalea quercina L-15889]
MVWSLIRGVFPRPALTSCYIARFPILPAANSSAHHHCWEVAHLGGWDCTVPGESFLRVRSQSGGTGSVILPRNVADAVLVLPLPNLPASCCNLPGGPQFHTTSAANTSGEPSSPKWSLPHMLPSYCMAKHPPTSQHLSAAIKHETPGDLHFANGTEWATSAGRSNFMS